jgi:sugar phosphate isomerase/epimerase
MKLSTTTLGCPAWTLDEIITNCSEYGLDGVDFRGIEDTIDVTQLAEFTSGINETKKKLDDVGLEVSGISSSIRVCVPEKLEDHLEEARRTIAAVKALDCGQIRVFGGGDSKNNSREELADMGRDTVEQILELDGAQDLKWVFETHDEWIKAVDCKLLLDRVPAPAFGVLWDVGHTTRVGEESPAETYAAVGSRTFYTHVKDATYDTEHTRAMQDGWRYVPPGTGQLPLAEAIALLKENDYDGWIMFEHEKRWHDELQEPEVIFPQFVGWVRPLIG